MKNNLNIISKSHLNYIEGYGFYYIKNSESFHLMVNIKYCNLNNVEKQTPGYSVLSPH